MRDVSDRLEIGGVEGHLGFSRTHAFEKSAYFFLATVFLIAFLTVFLTAFFTTFLVAFFLEVLDFLAADIFYR